MTDAWRRTLVFAGGLLVGAAVAAWIFRAPAQQDEPARAGTAAPQLAQAPEEPPPAAPPAAAPMRPQASVVQPVSCTFDPLVARSDPRDGQFALQELRAGPQLTEASAYSAVASEMAASGRARDAEVALIMACRVAGVQAGAGSELLADTMVALAHHYADAARQSPRAADLLVRAKALMAGGVRAYTAALGQDHDKVREAGEQYQALVRAAQAPQAVAAANREPTTALGAARESAVRQSDDADSDADAAAEAAAAGARTSFDCGQARSPSERQICSDPQLAQLDRDLGRLHQQAASVSADPRGFNRRHEQAWLRRESQCRGDKACLLRWYEDRRAQLLGEFRRSAAR